jgi:hypothetical protein
MPGLHSSHWNTRVQWPPKLGTHARSAPWLSSVMGVSVSAATCSHFSDALGDSGRGPLATARRSEMFNTYMQVSGREFLSHGYSLPVTVSSRIRFKLTDSATAKLCRFRWV